MTSAGLGGFLKCTSAPSGTSPVAGCDVLKEALTILAGAFSAQQFAQALTGLKFYGTSERERTFMAVVRQPTGRFCAP